MPKVIADAVNGRKPKAIIVEATYENGVLKPAQALPLKENDKVTITVQPTSSRLHPVGTEQSPALPRGYSTEEIRALLKIDKPAPDDATVEQWMEEHRLEKYGA